MAHQSTGWEITEVSGITGMIETPIASISAGGAAYNAASRLYNLTRAAGCFSGLGVASQMVGVGTDILGYKVRVA